MLAKYSWYKNYGSAFVSYLLLIFCFICREGKFSTYQYSVITECTSSFSKVKIIHCHNQQNVNYIWHIYFQWSRLCDIIKEESGTARNVIEKTCIVHFRQNKSDTTIKPLTDIFLKKIRKSVVTKRYASDDEHIRLDDICSAVPEVNHDLHGIYRWWYQNFTHSSSYLKRKRSCHDWTIQCPSASKWSRMSEASTLFTYECIFCGKVRKSIKQKEEPLTKYLTLTADKSMRCYWSKTWWRNNYVISEI